MLLTIIALSLIWLGVKDTRLEPVVSAQNQGWDAPLQEWDDDPLAPGFPDPNLGLPHSSRSGYVCKVKLYSGAVFANTPDGSMGDHGALRLLFFKKPNCRGNRLGWGEIYSEGATYSYSHPNYLYSEAALMSVYENAARAAQSGQRITYFRCGDETPICIKYMEFRTMVNDLND